MLPREATKSERPRISFRTPFLSVRVRIAASAFVVVAITLSLGGTALVLLLNRSLMNGLSSTAIAEASEVAVLERSGSSAHIFPARAGVAVQVVNSHGLVIGSSSELSNQRPVTTFRPPVGQDTVLHTRNAFLGGGDDDNLTAAVTVSSPLGIRTVYAVASTNQIESTSHDLEAILLSAIPILVIASGILAWLLAGRALKPVEDIRAEVAALSMNDLNRRITEPDIDDEIGKLARTMNDMLGRLEVSTARQRQFVSDASHELRSPLSALLAQVDVARAHPDSANWENVARVVNQEGIRLGSIIEDLLLLARSDEGHLMPGSVALDLDDLVLGEAELLRARGRVSVDLGAMGAAKIVGDREQLYRVIRNLCDNAERHAFSKVSISLSSDGGWIELNVQDDGPGIPIDERERIFERFARVDQGRDRPTGGTGLGLAIVQEIVYAYHGTISVADCSSSSKATPTPTPSGACFTVRLPGDWRSALED